MSVGVRGLRVGTGPRGHYVHAGRGGLYYRASLGRAGQSRRRTAPREYLSPVESHDESGVVMVDVESGSVLEMQPESHSQLIAELNQKQQQIKFSALFMWSFIALGFVGLFVSPTVALTSWGLAVVGLIVGRWLDSYRRCSVLFYDLEPEAEAAYSEVTAAFDEFMKSAGKWHVEAGGLVTDLTTWKRNAGASHIVRKKPTVLAYNLPSIIKSNVTPPALAVGRQVLFFLPDVVLVVDGKQIGAVAYSDLRIQYQDSRFIEEASVPSDAIIVGQTWQHPNKNGGPDRRFANNRQIPICLYEVMHLQSASGLNELVEFSKHGLCARFYRACEKLKLATGTQSSAVASRLSAPH